MNKYLIGLMSICIAHGVHAGKTQGFSDNDNITVELSKTNYNRLFVANDAISKARFPENFAVTQTDGENLFVDLKSTEPFTVFVATKAGHQFSMTIKPIDALGQTVQLVPKTPSKKLAEIEHKAPQDEHLTKVIQAIMNNQTPVGYGEKSVFSSFKPFNNALRFRVQKQWVGDTYIGEAITLYNHTSQPVTLDESWFKDDKTRVVALGQPVIAPKSSESVYIVREQGHA